MSKEIVFDHKTNDLLEAIHMDKKEANRLVNLAKELFKDFIDCEGRKSEKIEKTFNKIKNEPPLNQAFMFSIHMSFLQKIMMSKVEKEIREIPPFLDFMQHMKDAEIHEKENEEHNMYQ